MARFIVGGLKVGEDVNAEVAECDLDGHLLVSFRGELVRVNNHTDRRFKVGDKITMRVRTIDPLAFQLVTRKFNSRLDLSI